MKKGMILLCLAFGVFACSSPEDVSVTQAPTSIKVEQLFEFGQVKQGEIVKAKFTITNTGKVPLNIVRVEPSCGCTVANYTKEPILPGESGWVSGEVNTDRFEGEIRKSLNVLANTSPTTTTLIIKGVVNK